MTDRKATKPACAPKNTPPGKYFYQGFTPYILNQVTNILNKRFKRELKAFDLSVSQWRVLASLTTADSLSLNEVASYTAIDQPTLSRLIDQLVERSLVRRAPRPSDGRFAEIALSPSGRDKLTKVWPMCLDMFQDVTSALSDREREQLQKILVKLMNSNKNELSRI